MRNLSHLWAGRWIARAVMVSALSTVVAARAVAGEDLNAGEPLALWDALGIILPERSTVQIRWFRQDRALFEAPVTRQIGTVRVRTLYPCRLDHGRWTCTGPDEEIEMEANGLRHVVHVTNVQHDVALRIVRYVYSGCFETQRAELRKTQAKFYWSGATISITRISDRADGLLQVHADGRGAGLTFRLKVAVSDDSSTCGFQLVNIGGWVAMRPNLNSSGRGEA